MARDGLLSKVGLALGCLAAVVLIFVVALGWFERSKRTPTPPSSQAARSPAGWEIRYNATLALARRGSNLVKSRLDVLAEMLDEEQQRQNFRTTGKDGRDEASDVEVVQSVSATLKAITELHRRQPDLDLSTLYPALDKLADTGSPVLRGEAQGAKKALNAP